MIQKYAAALISVGIILVGYLAQLGDGVFGGPNVVQLGALVVAAIGTYVAPLLAGRWAAAAKVALPVLAAIFAAVYPFVVAGHLTGNQIAIVFLAALQALGAQVGADLRLDAAQVRATPAHQA